jgi:hypothetical protein
MIASQKSPRIACGDRPLARGDANVGRDAPLLRDLGAALAAHEIGEAARQVALVGFGKGGVEHVGDGETEHAVAQELQALVAARAARGGADVGQRDLQHRAIAERVAERGLHRGEVVRRQWIGLNIRCQRTVHGHSQTFQAESPCLTEKKITSARPIRFSKGT